MKNLSSFVCGLTMAITLVCCGSNNAYAVGATTPFTTYEGEDGTLGGDASVVTFVRSSVEANNQSSPELEASGHAYVQLAGPGQSVTWTNNTGHIITALNVRFCTPDDPATGKGTVNTLDLYVNGTMRQAVTFNSAQEWEYETSLGVHGTSKTPGPGLYPHQFWDETHFFITGAAVAPGGTIMFKQGATNTAAFYRIDCVDVENPPAPTAQPADSLSITDYGAVADDPGKDNITAINDCFKACKAQGKIAWIPVGTFYLNNASKDLDATGITIQGAGMWYSVIYAAVHNGNILHPTSTSVQDIMFDSSSPGPHPGEGGLNIKGDNWTINRVWAQHIGAGFWADGNNGIIENCRTSTTWGDGININNGNGGHNNNQGNNITVNNNFVRGSGDDGIAVNCGEASSGCEQMMNPTVTNNTVVAPWWANNFGIYGGQNLLVADNLCTDSVSEQGISLGTFAGWGILQSGLATRNTLLRCGCYGGGHHYGALNIGNSDNTSVKNIIVTNNTISNSIYSAITMLTSVVATVQNNTINSPGATGILVKPGATGFGVLNGNVVTDLASGQAAFVGASSYQINLPTQAGSYNSKNLIQMEPCVEGGDDVGYIGDGSYTEHNNVNLTDDTMFVARVASYLPVNANAGSIGIHLDSPTGTLIGTATVMGTAGWQNWTTVNCDLNGSAAGYHDIYLVYTGAFNIEWFSFFATVPVSRASKFSSKSNVDIQGCSEGGQTVDSIGNGSYTVYENVNLDGVTNFYARVASAGSGGKIEVRLDSETGTLLGTATVSVTGGWQAWTTVSCSLSGASGTHNLCLVYTGGGGYLFNLEWFAFVLPTLGVTEVTGYNSASPGIQTQKCSEGGLDVAFTSDGSYTVHNDVSMTGLTIFNARVASPGSGGSIQIRLDSPTGTLVGTCTVPETGGGQTWATVSCNLTASTGTHNLYLVYAGGSDRFNIEWFNLLF